MVRNSECFSVRVGFIGDLGTYKIFIFLFNGQIWKRASARPASSDWQIYVEFFRSSGTRSMWTDTHWLNPTKLSLCDNKDNDKGPTMQLKSNNKAWFLCLPVFYRCFLSIIPFDDQSKLSVQGHLFDPYTRYFVGPRWFKSLLDSRLHEACLQFIYSYESSRLEVPLGIGFCFNDANQRCEAHFSAYFCRDSLADSHGMWWAHLANFIGRADIGLFGAFWITSVSIITTLHPADSLANVV